MPALEYVAGESMTSSEFSANSEQNWPWPESSDAPVAAPDQHAILFENEEVRVIRTRFARASGSFAYASWALRFVHFKLVSLTPPRPSGRRGA